jgi:hypothetical protein
MISLKDKIINYLRNKNDKLVPSRMRLMIPPHVDPSVASYEMELLLVGCLLGEATQQQLLLLECVVSYTLALILVTRYATARVDACCVLEFQS